MTASPTLVMAAPNLWPCCPRASCQRLVQQVSRRSYHNSESSIRKARTMIPEDLPPQFIPQLPRTIRPETLKPKIFKPFPAGPSIKSICADPVNAIATSQMKLLDPTGARARMFDYENPEGTKVGDILLTTFKTGEPFSGVVLAIKSRNQDTSVLVRNHLMRVGAEMSIKVFSPNVASMEIVERTQKRKRRARLYYMRQPRHDRGSVQGIVDNYLKQKAALTGGKVATGKKGKKGGRR